MSKLPNISSVRSSILNTEIESTNNRLESPKGERKILLPILTQENNVDLSKNHLSLNSKLTELETKYISLEQSYEYILSKISTNEKRIILLQNNINKYDNNLSMNLPNNNKKNFVTDDQDKNDRLFTLLNNKIKYLEEMLKSDQEVRAQEKQKDLEFTQNLFNKINSSMINTIQMEVEQRFKSDLLQKNSNMKEIDLLQNQINAIKSQIEQMHNLFMKKLEENNNECSERNQNLAKYIDVRLDDQKLKKDTRELKKFIEKLTEQIKNNMNNQKTENDSCNQKIKNAEKKLDNSIKEVYDFLNKIELRVVNKIKNIKKYFDINLLTSNNLIERNVERMLKQYEKNFVFFSEELLTTRNYANIEFQNINKKIKFNNQAFVSDMENIIKHQVQLENIVKNRFNEIELMKKSIFKEMSNLESKANIDIKNEKILRECQNNIIKLQLKEMSNSVGNTTEAVFSSINKLLTENSENNNFNKKKFIEIDKILLINKNNFVKIEANVYDTITKVLLNEMTQKVMEEAMLQEISKIKLFEKNIVNNRNEIRKLNDRIVDAFNSLGGISQQGTKINDMLVEKEIRDDVQNMMQRMVEECVLAEVKEENNKKIKNLEEKYDKKWDEQDNKNNDITLNIADIEKKGENLVKDLEIKLNTTITKSNINNSVTEIITNTEIENLYELINKIKSKKFEAKIEDKNLEKVFKLIEDNNEITKKALANYTDILDNKLNTALEKVKQDNINMWENSISLGQKINTPEEIRKLIREIPPVISPLDETLQKIMDLNFKHPEPKPFIPDLYENEKNIDEQNFGKIVVNPKKEENKKEENEEIKINENNNNNNNNNNKNNNKNNNNNNNNNNYNNNNINNNNNNNDNNNRNDNNNNNNNNIQKESEKNSNGTKNSNNSKSTGSKKNKK